ncbi:5-methylcytosine rRNA methyltransferase NSUN4-like isoform X2 [Stegodyphus dumicola]|uniref:5-methylcytosine rRNA methyltransferase NSUN4-like isoform X2 n=1 Tax=Stegodyphus dumicola TaxID=202533 RepID=UPI0015AE6989|nr:5-methylcytosine rRNA methyltransferase NSUN4-like isoform X2 [Stegodyphus dumicola]
MIYADVVIKFKSLPKVNISLIRRYSTPRLKRQATELALNHFDQFYSPVFKNWASIRLGLLSPHSYCAVTNVFTVSKNVYDLFGDCDVYNLKDVYYLNLNEFHSSFSSEKNVKESCQNSSASDSEHEPVSEDSNSELCTGVEHYNEDEYMPATKFKYGDVDLEEECFEFFKPTLNYNAQLVPHGIIQYPENWNIYFCPRGKFRKFPPPKEDSTGLLSKLVCNDSSVSRLNKLKTVLNSYLPASQDWSKRILVSNLDVCEWTSFELFDKILLDVPCTNDRLSATKDSNNIFQQKRFNERLLIPRVQTSMLCAALKALKPNGSLVYSTCSLSPLQNDGVVHMSLSKLLSECPFEFIVNDLSDAFNPVRKMFQFSDTCKYGQLVVPYLPLNYGPMYISKISRVK